MRSEDQYVPRLKDVRKTYASQIAQWISGDERGGTDANIMARRRFDRLMDQIRASERAIGRQEASKSKHLSDAECAAEYWRARFAWLGSVYSRKPLPGMDGPVCPDSFEQTKRLRHELNTLARFADRRHAPEEN